MPPFSVHCIWKWHFFKVYICMSVNCNTVIVWGRGGLDLVQVLGLRPAEYTVNFLLAFHLLLTEYVGTPGIMLSWACSICWTAASELVCNLWESVRHKVAKSYLQYKLHLLCIANFSWFILSLFVYPPISPLLVIWDIFVKIFHNHKLCSPIHDHGLWLKFIFTLSFHLRCYHHFLYTSFCM